MPHTPVNRQCPCDLTPYARIPRQADWDEESWIAQPLMHAVPETAAAAGLSLIFNSTEDGCNARGLARCCAIIVLLYAASSANDGVAMGSIGCPYRFLHHPRRILKRLSQYYRFKNLLPNNQAVRLFHAVKRRFDSARKEIRYTSDNVFH